MMELSVKGMRDLLTCSSTTDVTHRSTPPKPVHHDPEGPAQESAHLNIPLNQASSHIILRAGKVKWHTLP